MLFYERHKSVECCSRLCAPLKTSSIWRGRLALSRDSTVAAAATTAVSPRYRRGDPCRGARGRNRTGSSHPVQVVVVVVAAAGADAEYRYRAAAAATLRFYEEENLFPSISAVVPLLTFVHACLVDFSFQSGWVGLGLRARHDCHHATTVSQYLLVWIAAS